MEKKNLKQKLLEVSKAIKYLKKTIPRGNRYYGDIARWHSFPLHSDEFGILVIHIIDIYLVQFA